jgi:hypothetical protein
VVGHDNAGTHAIATESSHGLVSGEMEAGDEWISLPATSMPTVSSPLIPEPFAGGSQVNSQRMMG